MRARLVTLGSTLALAGCFQTLPSDVQPEAEPVGSSQLTLVETFANYDYPTEILVASIRGPLHFIEAARMGAHVGTCPPSTIHQLLKHPLTDIGLEKFLADWHKSQA